MLDHILLDILVALSRGRLFRLPRDPDGRLRVSQRDLKIVLRWRTQARSRSSATQSAMAIKLGALLSFRRLASQTACVRALADPKGLSSATGTARICPPHIGVFQHSVTVAHGRCSAAIITGGSLSQKLLARFTHLPFIVTLYNVTHCHTHVNKY